MTDPWDVEHAIVRMRRIAEGDQPIREIAGFTVYMPVPELQLSRDWLEQFLSQWVRPDLAERREKSKPKLKAAVEGICLVK